MVVGYVLVGAISSLISSMLALLLGASLRLAFGLYALVGTATVVLAPVARLLASNFADQGYAPTAGDSQNSQSDARLIEPVLDQLVARIEASIRILAIDDDPFILELIPKISEKVGFSELTPAAPAKRPWDC